MLESWEREAERGARYVVKLAEVKSDREQGAAFVDLLSSLPEVKDVKKLSFAAGRLEVELFYPPGKDLAALEAAILEAAAKTPALGSLDVTHARGRELALRL